MSSTPTMSTAQAAEYLGVSPRTVRRLAESGELPYLLKLPGATGSYVFNADDVEVYKATRPRPDAAREAAGLWPLAA